MREYVAKNLSATRLMTLGDLDIRRVAIERATLTADEYFAAVEKFLESMPEFVDIVRRASNPEDLARVRDSLLEIGSHSLAAEVDFIRSIATSDRRDFAQKRGNEVFTKLNTLYERTKSAFVRRRLHSEAEANTRVSTVLLSEALEYFDYQESRRKPRILAVDDVAVVLHTLTSLLSRYYEVFSLTRASQVESFLTHTTPELFLLDIEMPEMNGYELLQVIRQFEEHKDTPIIFLTANASMENLKNAIAMGASDFITKPINQAVLLQKIESRIVRKKAY